MRSYDCLLLLLRRGEERTNVVLWSSELGAFAKRVICFFSLRQTWLASARLDCDAWDICFPFGSFCQDCWHHVGLILEWNGCFLSYECFSVHSFTVTPAGSPATVIRLKHYAIILWTLTPEWHRPGLPPQSPGYYYYRYVVIYACKYYVANALLLLICDIDVMIILLD